MLLLRPLVVGLCLAALAAAQTAAALRLPLPLEGVELRSTKENYAFTADGRVLTVSFQLRNEGREPVRVIGIGEDLPGLELVDVVAAGEPLGFRSRGAGDDDLPPFRVTPGTAVVVAMTYQLVACASVPETPRPVPVAVRDGRSRGTVRAALPQLPDDTAGAGTDDLAEWQSVLVRELCA